MRRSTQLVDAYGQPVRNSYDAGAQTRRTLGWQAPASSANTAVLLNLSTLRNRSRAAVRNDGFAKGIIEALVSNLVGYGIKPLSQAPDETFRKVLHQIWNRWTDESDADGQFPFYGQQAQAARAWLEGGETFVRLRPRLLSDGLSVPLQVQVLEPELCPHTHTVKLPNGNQVRAGIEFNAIGRRVAYYFHPSRPGDDQDYDASRLTRVPAERVIHLYDPLRPGQLRGLPTLTPSLIRLHELDKFDDATLLRQQLANLFVAFIKRSGSPEDVVNPLTGLTTSESRDDRPVVPMEPGMTQELADGEEMQFSEPPDVPQGYADFLRHHLMAACTAAGVPYEVVTSDMRGVNDRTVRVILNEFRRRIQSWQHQILAHQVCRVVWAAWFDRALLAGAIPMPAGYAADPATWRAVSWMPPKWAYIHPVQDVQAQKEAIRAGFTSRAAVVAENGEDAEEIDRQQAADNTRADELGLRYDSDGRQKASAAAVAAPATTPDDGENDGLGEQRRAS